jgi:hypothetical protein
LDPCPRRREPVMRPRTQACRGTSPAAFDTQVGAVEKQGSAAHE